MKINYLDAKRAKKCIPCQNENPGKEVNRKLHIKPTRNAKFFSSEWWSTMGRK
jgi:hypothetical protein